MKPSCTCKGLWRKPLIPEGYAGGAPYATIDEGIATDGIGRHHARLIVKCERCSGEFTAVRVHLPTLPPAELILRGFTVERAIEIATVEIREAYARHEELKGA